MKIHSFDRKINNIENILTKPTWCPGLGTLAGIAKVALGALQFSAALFRGLLEVIPAAFKRDWTYFSSCMTHVKHGLGNIMVGTLESIPVVQTLMWFARKLKASSGSDIEYRVFTGHEKKWMAYDSLRKEDLQIVDIEKEPAKKYNEILHNKINASGGRDKLSYVELTKLAQEVISDKGKHKNRKIAVLDRKHLRQCLEANMDPIGFLGGSPPKRRHSFSHINPQPAPIPPRRGSFSNS